MDKLKERAQRFGLNVSSLSKKVRCLGRRTLRTAGLGRCCAWWRAVTAQSLRAAEALHRVLSAAARAPHPRGVLSHNHRITEQQGLEGTSVGHLVQPFLHLPLCFCVGDSGCGFGSAVAAGWRC